MSGETRKRGMVLPLSLLAMIAVMGLVTTLGGLNQGVKNQIYRTNNHQLSFLIAFSAFSRVCAKIHSFSWANRPFLTEPYTETRVALQGGHYDLLVEDTVGKDYQADIYIRTHLAGISRMYFWRIRFNDDLLDISNSIVVELYATPEVTGFPTVGGSRTIAGEVENLLVKRADNQRKSDQLAVELVQANNIKNVIEKLNGRIPEDFQQNWPVSTIEQIMDDKDPVEPPNLAPPLAEERPSAPGPSQGASGLRLVGDGSSMTGVRIAELSADLITAAKKLVTNTDLAWDENDEHGVGMSPIAQEYHQQAAEAKSETYSALDGLISQSKLGIAEAPSTEARVAMEEMVAQTVVAGMGGIARSIERSCDHLATNDMGHLEGLPDSTAVQSLVNDWKAAEERIQTDLNKLTSISGEISGYSMASEVSQTMASALATAAEGLEIIRTSVAAAEARLAELLEKEAAAAAAAAGAGAGTIEP